MNKIERVFNFMWKPFLISWRNHTTKAYTRFEMVISTSDHPCKVTAGDTVVIDFKSHLLRIEEVTLRT